ncbi:hypothetical protein PV326_006608 [Microctonus aethiopoides]|nr:hypothetical protein PV326_006608 [Microctonus aethiopoides]
MVRGLSRSREEKITGMVLTVTEDTPADMLAGSMELLVQLPRDHHIHTQRVTVERSTAMMDLLVQIATAHKLAASSYTLQAIGEHGLVKLLPKQGTFIPRKTKLASQPFETTFRLQVHLPRNQLYVSRVSPKTNLGDILEDVCREKNLDKNKYELRHPGNHKETLDLSLSLQDYHLQEVTLYAKQGQSLGSALSSQDIMALQRQEERRRQQAKQSVFGFIFKKSKESSLSTDSLGGRSVSPARSDETGRSISPLAPPTRPQRKRRPAPNPPTVIHQTTILPQTNSDGVKDDDSKEKLVISHSRNSSDSSGYHEASVLSDNPESAGRMPETLPRRSRPPSKFESRKLAQTSQTSKSLCNLATSSGGGLTHAISNTSLSSTGIRKKRAAPKPPISRPLSSAISTQALERIVDSEESLTSDMGISKPPSDIAGSSGTEMNSKANSDIAMSVHASTKLVAKNFCHTSQLEMNNDGKRQTVAKLDDETCRIDVPKAEKNISTSIEDAKKVERARVAPQGKLVRSGSSFDDNGPTYSFISQNRYEIINEVNETSNLSLNCVRENVISSDKSMGNLKVPKKFVCKANINSPTLENLRHQNEFTVPRRSVHGITTFESLKHHNDVMIEEKLVKIPTIINLNNIDMNNTSTGKSENAIDYNSKARNKNLKKIPIDRNDKSSFLMNSHSFCCSNNHLQNFKDRNNIRTSLRRVSKSGDLTMTNSHNYNDSVTSLSSNGKKICSLSDHDLTSNNSSSPPSKNTLQIFAISTEPVNIHAPQMNLIPNEINDIPSFPLLNKFQSNTHSNVNKKLNILEPPPPGLVSREESNENWNQFLIQLNTIIESRVAPVPKPRNISKGPPITPRRMFNHELSLSTSDVESNISVKNISKTININDFDEKNVEQQDDGEINKYTNSNNERSILEHANEFIMQDNNKVDNNDVINKFNESCAVISTVPKCSQLTSEISGTSSIVNEKNMKDDKLTKSIDEKLLVEVSKKSPRSKVFQSVSAFSNFDVNSFEKNNKKVTNSHDRNFTCALNPNFSTSISHMEVNEKMNLVMKTPRNALSENDTCEEQYPSFITHSTNLGLQMDLTHSTVEEKLYSQRMGKAGVDDSPTETDLLLQKVSTTLANVSPISERLSQDVPSNEVNHVEKMDRVNSKADKAPAHDETGLDSTPNMTLNSQQDTSDYVSATGEDLSATDWEYQLPDPPSAFRDNIAPDHDDYETITLRSVDAFKEPIVTIINSTEKDFNRQVNVQNEPEHLMQPDTKTTIPAIITTTSTMTHLINEKCDEKNINIKEINGDMNTPRLSLENHKKDSNNELKKEVISELENKIENGIFNPPNRKYSDEEFNQSCVDKLAPNIAPIENTLPNFTITTYPRQKNLNIYDSSVSMSSSHLTDSTQDRIVKTFATLSRNTSALSRKKESYTDSSNHNHRQGNNFEINNSPIIRATSIQHINLSSEGLKNPIEETIKVPQRHQDTANSNDKTNIVHRSKSYIVLSHNSKYRSNKTLVSNIIDDKSMIKSTSVTNLNQDTSAIDKEKSRNQEKDLKNFHNEKNENRELQSVQVLKSILPQLKDTQHTDKSASEISVTEHYNEEKILATKSDETDEVQMRNKTEAQTERNKSESDETIKRWRYTGPPAISLGSWSERPCLNVKIKMDTDYKFSVNNNNINHYSNSNNINNNSNNNNNTTGAKTIVNLNSSSNDVDIVNYKDSFIKNLPKNHVKNDNVKLSSNDTKESDVKRVMDDVGIMKKKITNTSLNQMQSGLKNFEFVKLRMRSRDESDKPVVVTNVAVKKSYAEKPELKDDDIKIDTRPVNFKALTQAFGQVNLRAIPKHNSQNRHSDYFDARQNDNDFVDNKFMKRQTNIIAGEINRPPIKRYTSVIGIDAQPSINNFKKINEDIKKIHSTTTKVNGPAPIVKGFHINHPNKTSQISNSTTIQKNSFTLNNKINGHVPPPPPTMPVITGVTLKSNNAAPKSMSTCKDPRDQLLESIRNYGRDKLKNVNTVS